MTALDLRRWVPFAAVCASLLACGASGVQTPGCVLALGQIAALCGRTDARVL